MYSEKLELLIAGEWCQGSEGKTEPLLNPATEEVIAQVPHASASDLDRAINASLDGFKHWRNVSAAERQQILEKAACLMEERVESIATTLTLEQGKPIQESRLEMGFVISVLRWLDKWLSKSLWVPVVHLLPGISLVTMQSAKLPVHLPQAVPLL